MRVGLAALLAASCASAPPCTLATCGAMCEHGPVILERPASAVLTPFEAGIFRPVLDALRRGHHLDLALTGLCRGEQACDTFLGTSVDHLEPGSYHLQFGAILPEPAIAKLWSIEVYETCVLPTFPGDYEAAEERERSVRLALQERTETLTALPFEVTADTTERRCAWRAFLSAPGSERKSIEGRWAVLSPTPDDSDAVRIAPAAEGAPAAAPASDPP